MRASEGHQIVEGSRVRARAGAGRVPKAPGVPAGDTRSRKGSPGLTLHDLRRGTQGCGGQRGHKISPSHGPRGRPRRRPSANDTRWGAGRPDEGPKQRVEGGVPHARYEKRRLGLVPCLSVFHLHFSRHDHTHTAPTMPSSARKAAVPRARSQPRSRSRAGAAAEVVTIADVNPRLVKAVAAAEQRCVRSLRANQDLVKEAEQLRMAMAIMATSDLGLYIKFGIGTHMCPRPSSTQAGGAALPRYRSARELAP